MQSPCYTAAAAECKLFRKLNLRSTFYTDTDMLKRFPLTVDPCCSPLFPVAAECKLFKKLNLRSTFYTDGDMLARFPLRACGERNRDCDAVPCPPGSRCALCGKKDTQEDMTRTDCCDQVRTIIHTLAIWHWHSSMC